MLKKGKTFAEKILKSQKGTIVWRKPDLILSHDNTFSISKTFEKYGGKKVIFPQKIVVVLDHNSPATSIETANQHQSIRKFVRENDIKNFYDIGSGICHQIMSYHAKPGMLIVGSDSHTCTSGAFNSFAVGIDRTETAKIWKTGKTWFRVPETIKIILTGTLSHGVFAKDLALWIAGMLGADGAIYKSIEFHGDGVKNLTISDRMTIANFASEIGAKNAVFEADEVLADFLGSSQIEKIWSDDNAEWSEIYEINMCEIMPLIAAPHQVDNIKTVKELVGTKIEAGFIGTCTNGRIEDLRIAAMILKDKKIAEGFQLYISPASQEIYLKSIEEGLVEIFAKSGANLLIPSCGLCMGTSVGIPGDGVSIISTANRNFKGRMGNKNSFIYLASPATVAKSSIHGFICEPDNNSNYFQYPFIPKNTNIITKISDLRRTNLGVWNYSDVDNLNTDLMFPGRLTYSISSNDKENIAKHLFEDFDSQFANTVQSGDILITGENFGCGSSREHPTVGFAAIGIKAIIVKSANRIFYRSAINQSVLLIILPEFVSNYNLDSSISIDLNKKSISHNNMIYTF